MKQKITHTQLIFLSLTALFGIAFLGYFYSSTITKNSIQQQKERNFTGEKSKFKIWVIGDSHPLLGFEPKQIEGSFNWAGTSENYALNYFKIKYLLKGGYKPNHIILSAEYHGFSSQGLSLLKNHELDDCYWVSRIALSEFVKDVGDPGLCKWWIGARFFPFAGQYYSIFSSYFRKKEQITTLGFLDTDEIFDSRRNKTKELNDKIKSHTKGFNMIDPIQVLYLKKIVDLCEANQIRISIIRFPIHPDYHYLLSKNADLNKIDSIYRVTLRRHPLLDFSRLFDQNTNYFSDPDHLNKPGAKVFTAVIRDSILNLNSKEL